MSAQKHIIEIETPQYGLRTEQASFRNYRCPECNGRGGFTEQVGHNQSKTTICDCCDGTGKLRANVTIEWTPDYD